MIIIIIIIIIFIFIFLSSPCPLSHPSVWSFQTSHQNFFLLFHQLLREGQSWWWGFVQYSLKIYMLTKASILSSSGSNLIIGQQKGSILSSSGSLQVPNYNCPTRIQNPTNWRWKTKLATKDDKGFSWSSFQILILGNVDCCWFQIDLLYVNLCFICFLRCQILLLLSKMWGKRATFAWRHIWQGW